MIQVRSRIVKLTDSLKGCMIPHMSTHTDRQPSPRLQALVEALLGEEAPLFWMWSRTRLPSTLRVNRMRMDPEVLRERLEAQGFGLEPHPLGSEVFVIREAPFPPGNTLEHYMGAFYLQSLASMIPPIVLDPQPGERVLDLTAAPGSKTTQIAESMRYTGVVVANELDRTRLKALSNNVDRMGAYNVVITELDGTRIGSLMPEAFDRVLLDAPCSALGTLHQNPDVLRWWNMKKVRRLAGLQRKLILSAYDALRPGGILVYATCTLTPHENEAILAWLLQQRPGAELLPLPPLPFELTPGLTRFQGQTYPEAVRHAARLYPHRNQTEGFFFARLRKS